MSDDKIVIRRRGRRMSLTEYGTRMNGDIKDAEIEKLRAFEAAHSQLQAALDIAIRERDEARQESDRLWTECEQLWNEYKKMCEIIKTIGARCVELDDREAVSAILDITETFLKNKS